MTLSTGTAKLWEHIFLRAALVRGALSACHPALMVWWARPHCADNGAMVDVEVDAGRAADYRAAFEEWASSGEAGLWSQAATTIEEPRRASRANEDQTPNPGALERRSVNLRRPD
jgi:hypothetical protein